MDTTHIQQYYSEAKDALDKLAIAHKSLQQVSTAFNHEYGSMTGWPKKREVFSMGRKNLYWNRLLNIRIPSA